MQLRCSNCFRGALGKVVKRLGIAKPANTRLTCCNFDGVGLASTGPHHRSIPSTPPAWLQKPCSRPLRGPQRRWLGFPKGNTDILCRLWHVQKCLLALAKFTLVSAAMLTMCSTITATRMLMHPKFRKMTDTLRRQCTAERRQALKGRHTRAA